jgi:hypothetical protein
MMNLALELADLPMVPADSAIYVEGKNIRKVLFGIDAAAPELILAKQRGYDGVISHHPQGGSAVINFSDVFSRHVHQMMDAGVPRHDAEEAVRKKRTALAVEMHTRNYSHAVDFAKLLKMPYMNIHTPLDEVGRRIMADQIRQEVKKDATIGDVVAALQALPEFKNAATGIKIRVGQASDPAGKTVVSHGAGTNGGYEIANAYFTHGVNTLIYIHVSPADLDKLKRDRLGNLIITGHIASDSVGINPFIQRLEELDISVTRLGIVPP